MAQIGAFYMDMQANNRKGFTLSNRQYHIKVAQHKKKTIVELVYIVEV